MRAIKSYLIDNFKQKIYEFDSIRKLKEFAKKHNMEIKKSPLDNNVFYTEDYSVIPPVFNDVKD
jgi:GH35 family endo-1,4-beta-xylanase